MRCGRRPGVHACTRPGTGLLSSVLRQVLRQGWEQLSPSRGKQSARLGAQSMGGGQSPPNFDPFFEPRPCIRGISYDCYLYRYHISIYSFHSHYLQLGILSLFFFISPRTTTTTTIPPYDLSPSDECYSDAIILVPFFISFFNFFIKIT